VTNDRRAFTLVEVLVGAGLAVVVAAVLVSVLVAGQRWGQRGFERADYQRMGLVTTTHLMHHLLGARELIHPIMGDSPACCFQGNDMRLHVYAYDRARRVLVHHVLDPETGDGGRAHVLATDLRAVRFSVGEGARLLQVKMAFARADERVKKRDVYVLETALALRN